MGHAGSCGLGFKPGVESCDSDERSAKASATSGKQEGGGLIQNQGFAGALLPGEGLTSSASCPPSSKTTSVLGSLAVCVYTYTYIL